MQKIKGLIEMYLKYSIGFLIASLVQAGIVMLSESLNISSLNAKLTFLQLLTHVIVGQVGGYILLYVMRKVKTIAEANTWVTGIIFGVIVWAVILPVNTMLGTVQAPWEQGIGTVLSTMLAFITYGVITTYTIKNYGYEGAEV